MADRVWNRAFPFRARRRLAGVELVATDTKWRAGSGPRVEGPMAALVLVLTGRSAGFRDLAGPGLEVLRRTSSAASGTTVAGRRPG